MSLLQKSGNDDINIFITDIDNYQTKVKALSDKDIDDIREGEIDPFFNIHRYMK